MAEGWARYNNTAFLRGGCLICSSAPKPWTKAFRRVVTPADVQRLFDREGGPPVARLVDYSGSGTELRAYSPEGEFLGSVVWCPVPGDQARLVIVD